MVKLLLIGLGLFVFSCDSSSPTEVTTQEDVICGYDDYEYLAGCDYSLSTAGCPDVYENQQFMLDTIGRQYCIEAGYNISQSTNFPGTYDVITSGTYQNVLSFNVMIPGQSAFNTWNCDNIGYLNEINPGEYTATENYPIIHNLVCE